MKFAKSHEWVRTEGNRARVGITDFAAKELGDVVFVELPEEGKTFNQNDVFGTIESVKAVSDIYIPVSGKIILVNRDLENAPEKINQSPFEDGWLVELELTNPAELDTLMDESTYRAGNL